MHVYEIQGAGGVDALALTDRERPQPASGEVLVRMHASSINYRDLTTIEDPVPRGVAFPRIPNSCGAGVVEAVGAGVSDFAPGDAVTSCFFARWEDGGITADAMASALGGAVDGVLAEQVVFNAGSLVHAPAHLDHVAASTLPCAALTAWNAVAEFGQLKPGQTVLLLGTGGVSIFALQFARVMGLRTIITSGSDEKLARAVALGADETVNYRTHPDWDREVLALTEGAGVDLTVEVGGAGTLERSVAATRVGGKIALIGVLTGGQINPVGIMRKSISLQGIYVGNRAMFKRMNLALQTHQIEPVVDRRFGFSDARDAYHAMRAAGHFGKLVVELA